MTHIYTVDECAFAGWRKAHESTAHAPAATPIGPNRTKKKKQNTELQHIRRQAWKKGLF